MTNKKIEEMINQLNEKMNFFIKKARNGCICHGVGMMFRQAISEMQADGFNIKYVIDDTLKKPGGGIEGIEVVSRNDSRIKGEKYIVGTIGRIGQLRASWKGENEVLFISFSEYLLWKHYSEYIKVRDCLLEDDKSRQIFNLAMYAQMTDYFDCDFTGYSEVNQYFAIPEFNLLTGEKFVDVGAYVGDIIDELIRHSSSGIPFEKYIGFEPDSRNIRAIEARKKRICAEWNLRDEAIEIVQAAVGNKNARGSLNQNFSGPANRISENFGEDGFEIIKLDDFLKDEEITFIKADVEGMEMEVLEGAAEIIRKQKPKMAICVYHLPWHLYEIAKTIKKLNSNYRFKMRLHSNCYSEIVLYCY